MTVRSTTRSAPEGSGHSTAASTETRGRQRSVPDVWLSSISPVRHGAGTAAWLQIRDDLRARISDGSLAPGDELPSELALAMAYSVSRLTIRRALGDLALGGLICTDHGVGSYVAPVIMRHRIDDGNVSLLESMASRGHSVRQLVLDIRDFDASERRGRGYVGPIPGLDEAGEELRFPDFPGPVTEYRYVRWVDEIPWSNSYALVPASLAPPVWDGSVSLFATIAQLHGLAIQRDDRRFSAVPADDEDARWLKVPVGSPLLLLNGLNTDEHGRAVARIVHRIRGDRAQYGVRVPK